MYHAVAHFTNQNAVVGQIIRRAGRDAAGQLQPVRAGRQTQLRLVTVLVRQVGHVFCIHVRRIGDDQVVLQRRQVAEQVRADRRDVMNQPVLFNVVFGDGQRVGGDIDGVHFRFRKAYAQAMAMQPLPVHISRMCCG